MYYDAIKSAFGCFPLEPPRALDIGAYVRITWGGRVHHYGNLSELLEVPIEFDEHVGDIEFLSSAVSKGGVGTSLHGSGEAKISFSNKPGIYLKGTRRVRRAKNLDSIYNSLSKADVDWSFRNRIVVETHSVENAELFCSGGIATDMKAMYGSDGAPVSFDADAAIEQNSLLHLPSVTGTIAFSPVRIVFGHVLGATSGDSEGYVVREMDVKDPDEFDPEGDEAAN